MEDIAMWNLASLMEYYRQRDIDLFENCTTPEPIDVDLLKSYIMRRCGLLQPIYGEPDLFKMQTKMWFDSNQWRMQHLVWMLLAEYNPSENIVEYDHWEEQHSGTDEEGGEDTFQHGETHTLSGEDTFEHGETHTLSGEDTLEHGETHTLSGTDTDTDTTSTEHTVSAFNTSTYQPDSMDQKGGSVEREYGKTDTASGTDTTGYGRTDTASGTDTTGYGRTDTASGTDTTGYGKTFTHGENIEYTRDRHGNVGVKSSSDLMQEELNLLERFNVYETLASWFEKDNMIQVY